MKNRLLSLVFGFFVSVFMYSQNSTSAFSTGDVFLIGKVNYNKYKHINFPRANFIIKKGGIVNYHNVIGKKVVIIAMDEKNNGKRVATIKLVERGKFFNSHKYVTVAIDEAIKSKELLNDS